MHPAIAPQYQKSLRNSRDLMSWNNEFKKNGVLVLNEFLHPTAIQSCRSEAEELSNKAYFKEVNGNIYLCPTDKSWPANHPGLRQERTRVGVVGGDQIPKSSTLQSLFFCNDLREALASILGKKSLYTYQCPMGFLNYSVMEEGDYLRWHFDLSDFVLSIPLQEAEDGGLCEYAHKIKNENSENWSEIHSLLDGDYHKIETLIAQPGSLILFEGRHTAHRVSAVRGKTKRLGALLGYVDSPHQGSSPYLRKIRYGRESCL